MFLYPMVVGLTKLLAKYITSSFPMIALVFLIDLAVIELFNYWAYAAVGIAKVGSKAVFCWLPLSLTLL